MENHVKTPAEHYMQTGGLEQDPKYLVLRELCYSSTLGSCRALNSRNQKYEPALHPNSTEQGRR